MESTDTGHAGTGIQDKKHTLASALLILDMQNDFFNHSGYHVAIRKDLAEKINNLIGMARAKEIPVIWVGRGFDDIPKEFASFLPTSVVCKNPGMTIDELDCKACDRTIARTRDDAFYMTGLDACLKTAGIKTIIIAGLYTHTSVMKTASTAKTLGYSPLVAVQCVTSNEKQRHEAAIGAMRMNRIIIETNSNITTILKAG